MRQNSWSDDRQLRRERGGMERERERQEQRARIKDRGMAHERRNEIGGSHLIHN